VQVTTRLQRLRHWIREQPVLADAAFAAALYALYAASILVLSAAVVPESPVGWNEFGALAVSMTPIALRRKWLWGAVLLALGTMAVSMAIDHPWLIGDSGFTWLILTYTAAAHRTLPRALAVSVAVWVPVTASVFFYYWPVQEGHATNASLISLLNWIMASTAFFVGWVMRNRRMKLDELADRARVAEESREALAAQAVADEQRRIARELHDVVAHHISVIGVMSEGAKRVLRTDPEAAEEALTTVNQTARTALREMRDILTVLRSQEEPDDAELAPQPTVDSLRALVAQTKEAGLPVRYSVLGEEYPLPTGVSLAVYRIAQEALTNTIKHAGPKAKAGVVVDYGEDEFRIAIGDSGRGAPVVTHFSGGHGLIGMRERATLYGGSLQAGPQPGGGYLVEAKFPKNAHLQGVSR